MTENSIPEDNSTITEAISDTKLLESYDFDYDAKIKKEFEDGEITDSTEADSPFTYSKDENNNKSKKDKRRKRRRHKYNIEKHKSKRRESSSSSSMKISQECNDHFEDTDWRTCNPWNDVAPSNHQHDDNANQPGQDSSISNSQKSVPVEFNREQRKKSSKSSRKNRNRRRNRRRLFQMNQSVSNQTVLPLEHLNNFTQQTAFNQENSNQQLPIMPPPLPNQTKKFSLLGDPPICNGQGFNFLSNQSKSGFMTNLNHSPFTMLPPHRMNFGLNNMSYSNDFHPRNFQNFMTNGNDCMFNNNGCNMNFPSSNNEPNMGMNHPPGPIQCQDGMSILNISARRRPSGFSHQPPPVRFISPQSMFSEAPIGKNTIPMMRQNSFLLQAPTNTMKTPLLPEPCPIFVPPVRCHQNTIPSNNNNGSDVLINHTLKEQEYVNDQLDKIARIVMSAKENTLESESPDSIPDNNCSPNFDSLDEHNSIMTKHDISEMKKPIVISIIGKKKTDASSCVKEGAKISSYEEGSDQKHCNEAVFNAEQSNTPMDLKQSNSQRSEINGLKLLQEMFNLPSLPSTGLLKSPENNENSSQVPITPQSPDLFTPVKDNQSVTLVPNYAKSFSSLALKDIPLKIPYPLMQIPGDIPMNPHDPRLKGRLNITVTTKSSADPMIKNTFSLNKQNMLKNELSNTSEENTLNHENIVVRECITPVGSWQPVRSVHKTRLNEMANGNFHIDSESCLGANNNRSYLYDPRFRRRKVTILSDERNADKSNCESRLCENQSIVKLEPVN